MDKNRLQRKGGWQANVEYFDDYVIKTPKTKDEIIERVHKYLNKIGKLEELDERVSDMQKGWKDGLEIIQGKDLPLGMLGFLEFLEDGRIKKRRVVVLEDIWNDLADTKQFDEMKLIIDKTIDFIVELWKYGLHEKTGKVGYEFGLMDDKIILIDFGELTEDKNAVEKQIKKEYWEKPILKHCRKEVGDYFNLKAGEILTLETLNENWNLKIEN